MGAGYLESFRFKAFLARVFVVVGLIWFEDGTTESPSPMLCPKLSD